MSQDFANAGAVQKVLDLFNDLEGNLHENRINMDTANAAQIVSYEHFMAVCAQTIEEAEARLVDNNAALDVVNAKIAHQEDIRDTAAADRDQAVADRDEEDARWDAVEAAYEDYIAELEAELDAIDRCIGVFATAEVDDSMLDRMDW